MKKALVYYLYGNRNAGDMAICIGTIELLKRHGYQITMVSRFSRREEEYEKSKNYIASYYPDVAVFPGPFSFERDFSAVKKIFSYAASFLKVIGLLKDHESKQLIQKSDVVFFNGGNLLRGSSAADYLRLIALFYPIMTARSLGKPIYCLPQSTAEISSFGEKLLRKRLRCFDTVFVREKNSLAELKSRFPDIPLAAGTDLAFMCQNTMTAAKLFDDLHMELPAKTAAVVVRNTGIGDIGELSAEKQKILQDKLIGFIQAHKDYSYVIVVQANKDRAFSHRIMRLISGEVNVQMIENHDPLVLREFYKHVDFLVTMRLHAGILSLSALTPVIGLFSEEWGSKNPGVMEDYDMPYQMIERCPKETPVVPAVQPNAIEQSIAENTQNLERTLQVLRKK